MCLKKSILKYVFAPGVIKMFDIRHFTAFQIETLNFGKFKKGLLVTIIEEPLTASAIKISVIFSLFIMKNGD